ncbi:hypothetical protein AG1IA_05620 [Rhizoctonia solani AG-1 IA]|uniref:Uncharacterized protein n=1 Tax=Thanatephorus cucumeris (strain AG1-IA) TaxID=983506 RepID=L8WQT3_THACA|nr:hypothetical protein AG1IA_05620 [Rhizoctonia solani AG-1 IA]
MHSGGQVSRTLIDVDHSILARIRRTKTARESNCPGCCSYGHASPTSITGTYFTLEDLELLGIRLHLKSELP